MMGNDSELEQIRERVTAGQLKAIDAEVLLAMVDVLIERLAELGSVSNES
jgi:hypothetical protein